MTQLIEQDNLSFQKSAMKNQLLTQIIMSQQEQINKLIGEQVKISHILLNIITGNIKPDVEGIKCNHNDTIKDLINTAMNSTFLKSILNAPPAVKEDPHHLDNS